MAKKKSSSLKEKLNGGYQKMKKGSDKKRSEKKKSECSCDKCEA
jgi:hypothetical protein